MVRSGDEELRRWAQEMRSSQGVDCSTYGVQEVSFKVLTLAVFCVSKVQDTKDTAKQRLSDLLILNSLLGHSFSYY